MRSTRKAFYRHEAGSFRFSGTHAASAFDSTKRQHPRVSPVHYSGLRQQAQVAFRKFASISPGKEKNAPKYFHSLREYKWHVGVPALAGIYAGLPAKAGTPTIAFLPAPSISRSYQARHLEADGLDSSMPQKTRPGFRTLPKSLVLRPGIFACRSPLPPIFRCVKPVRPLRGSFRSAISAARPL
jgi:hypothetical protein